MANAHFLLVESTEQLIKKFPAYYIGEIDGSKSTSMKDFHEQIGQALQFPDYSGKNLDALDEMLNDLEWIENSQVIVYISNSADWLTKEKDDQRILTILDIFDASAEDWKWMDDEDELPKKELKIVFQNSERIRKMLDTEEIPYALVD